MTRKVTAPLTAESYLASLLEFPPQGGMPRIDVKLGDAFSGPTVTFIHADGSKRRFAQPAEARP